MNDNIIKMFIGGEEVVSNKEFTINEEMLSASSTILNNCYPASWEESKDYVSNFYYPKDYSKYILGKGNFTYGTDQYYILTISGSNFIQFTTNVEKEFAGFTVYGKTTQETRSGKNLINILGYHNEGYSETVNGLTITYQNDGSVKVNGTANANTTYTLYQGSSILSAGQYTFSGSVGGSYSTYRLEATVTPSYTYFHSLNGSETLNLSSQQTLWRVYLIILNGTQLNNKIFYPMLEKGNTATDYEPYGVMPSPDYPSELVSVGYQNYLYHNQLPSTKANVTVTYNSDDNTYSLNGTANANWNFYILSYTTSIIHLEAGESVTYTIKRVSGTSKVRFLTYFVPDDGSTMITNWDAILNANEEYNIATRTATKAGKIAYVQFWIDNGITYDSKVQIMVTKGTQAYSYIPYGKYGIEVTTTRKNLIPFTTQNFTLNSIHYYINNGSLYFNGTSTSETSSLNANFKNNFNFTLPSGTYTISHKIGIMACYLYKYDNNTLITNLATNTISQTFTLSETTKVFIGFYVYQKTFDNVNSEIMISKSGGTYEPYQSNTQLYQLDNPLRAIGNYKDKLYIENGMLYVDRKIGSVVLDGSENWQIRTDYSYTNYNVFRNVDYRAGAFGTGTAGYSNYFKINASQEETNMIRLVNTNGYGTQITIEKSIANTVSDLKTWLSNNNVEVNFILLESYTEELGQVDIPYSYEEINNTIFGTGIDTEETIDYYWKNYDVLFAGIVKNSGDISLKPTNPKYCSLQILDYKTFLSESDTLDFVISDKTIAEAISMVVDAISGYGFILGTINISQADDIIGAYSTLNKTAYDVFQYLANISGSRWRARFVDSDTMAIDFYDPELLPRANDIDYTQQYWEDNKIVDLTFNYGTRDYRNKQIILSDEVYGGIDYTEVLLSNGYGTSYITQNNIANITSITVNGVEAEVITQSEKDLGVDADFYYTPGKNVVESTTSYTAGTQIIITYTPLVKGRQIVYNDEEVTRIATQTNTTGVISRYENRNDILSSDELENIAETYIKYKGKPEIILKLTTLNNDLFNIGEICYFNSPIADLAQDYMVKSKATNYTSVAGETNIFYTYELTSSFNSEKAINYFDNQRNKATGNIAEGESITRNIDINNSAMIIWENATITEISVSVDGDNALNSVLNSPFIQ